MNDPIEIHFRFKQTVEGLEKDFVCFKRIEELWGLSPVQILNLAEEDIIFMKEYEEIANQIIKDNHPLFKRKDELLGLHGEGIRRFAFLKEALEFERKSNSLLESPAAMDFNNHLEYMAIICKALEQIDIEIERVVRVRFLIEGELLGEALKQFY